MLRLFRFSLGALASVAALASCSDDTPQFTYHRDIRPLVEQKCAGCHVQGGIAPFALQSYDDLVGHKDLIRNAVSTRIMPPWLADPSCADYYQPRNLDDAQIATFTRWIDTGTPLGNPADYKAPMIAQSGLSRVDMTMPLPVEYTPRIRPDEYRCFLIDWPATSTKYVTGFRAHPGNPAIVHHVIAFLAPPAQVPEYEQLDAADPDPGYTCFGGPGGQGFGGWVGAWAPGSNGGDYPPGTGLKIEPGSKIILQVHYNTLASPPVPDQTKIEVKVDEGVDKAALMLPWADFFNWVRDRQMVIAAGNPDVFYSFSFDPTPFFSRLFPGFRDNVPFTIYGAGLHMHLRGTTATLRVDHRGGPRECLLEIPRWNFHWQMMYGFAQPKLFSPGDQLYIGCHWDNSAANQPIVDGQRLPPQDLNWGEGSTDEMCLGLVYITQ